MIRNLFSKIGTGENAPEEINVIIEIPKGHHNKYEFDEEKGVFKLDRALHSSLHYPTDYGFVPKTKADDGDPLDVIVVGGDPTFPGCLVEIRTIGLLKMFDDGKKDFKILGVEKNNPRLKKIKNIEDINNYNPHLLREITHFFEEYKRLEEKEVKIEEWGGKEEAFKEIRKAIKAW